MTRPSSDSADTLPIPEEEYALFNPAFLALLIRQCVAQHQRRADGRPMHAVLAYLATPLALHAPTRASLPSNVTSSMAGWITSNPNLLMHLPSHVAALRPYVSNGLMLALRHGVIESERSHLISGKLKRRPSSLQQTSEVVECLSVAGFLGRWFAEQTDPATTLALWGLRP